ncbi:MAG: hypothetical protein KA436_12180 [Oligoflexales bacterium]|nr:hypothetical protein [Oligoflexales bacterium]
MPNTRDRCGFVALCTVAKNFSPWWFHTKSFTPAGAVLNALEFIGKNPRYLELEDDAHLDAEPDDVELRYILDLLKKAASKRQEQPRPQTVGSSPAANSVFALLETLYFDGDGLTPEDAALIAALAGADLQTYVEPSDLGGQPTLSRGFYRPSSSRQPPVVLNLMEPSDHSHYSPLLRARPQHPDKRITQAQRVQIFTIEGRRYRRDSVVGDGFCGFTALNQAAAQQSMTFTIGAVGGYEINASSFVLAIQTFLPSGSGLWSILEHIEAAASNAAASGVGSEATATNLVHAAQTIAAHMVPPSSPLPTNDAQLLYAIYQAVTAVGYSATPQGVQNWLQAVFSAEIWLGLPEIEVIALALNINIQVFSTLPGPNSGQLAANFNPGAPTLTIGWEPGTSPGGHADNARGHFSSLQEIPATLLAILADMAGSTPSR